MDVDLITEGISSEEVLEFDENNDEYSNYEGEKCGICMDIIIDRGVLDCCQHWFCFTCIDNWATITNLCPLCQNEFQLITCVPVYDTIGSNRIEDDSSRDDDWCIEGKNNTLSFPSYYIDEDAVICLDGGGCKIRSGSAKVEEDLSLDTSIACDSCDIWYHAFCVGFDPEATCDNSWLCPRCLTDDHPQKLDLIPVPGPNNQYGPQNASDGCLLQTSYSGKVSVSVADAGETAVVVSMVEGNQGTEGPEEFFLTQEVNDVLKFKTCDPCKSPDISKLETQSSEKNKIQLDMDAKDLELSLSRGSSFKPPSSVEPYELKIISAEKTMKTTSFDGPGISKLKKLDVACESSLDLQLGLSMGSSLSVEHVNNDVPEDQVPGDLQQKIISEECLFPVEHVNNDVTEDQVPGDLQQKIISEECLFSVEHVNNVVTEDQVPRDLQQKIISEDTVSAGKSVLHSKPSAVGVTGVKRKHRDYSQYLSNDVHEAAEDKETKAGTEIKASAKRVRARMDSQTTHSKDQAKDSVSGCSRKPPSSTAASEDVKLRCKSEKMNVTTDIMSIVHGADRRTRKSSNQSENVSGLRVKKILRRDAENKESSLLVQKLRKEIRDAVRNKTSKESGENLFDPKLLAAFRAAVVGSDTEPVKKSPALVGRPIKSMLQKGKVRENLTRKIYAIGGRRKRAWTRDCQVEFWKHRCLKFSKPEKIETLKSVLGLLRKNPEDKEMTPGKVGASSSSSSSSNSILSRLYLADTSVFPRKDDVKPLIAMTSPARCVVAEEKKEQPNKSAQTPSISLLANSKGNSQKELKGKYVDIKTDKRKWAMEVLARKVAVSGGAQEKQEDNAALKGNYPLLAQLPIDMRPVLAPCRHNKIPMSVRQAQVYRLTEHFLRKTNMPVVGRTADTELAVADAVNIEKGIANRSNSKLVYVNLCSQELLRRSDDIKATTSTEPNSPPPTKMSVEQQVSDDVCTGSAIDEALINAGLLSDSPPNSPPTNPWKVTKDEGGFSPDNIFEMDPHPELDIYGDFEFDLEDEDYIGATSAVKPSQQQQQQQPERESQIKVVFSTSNSEILNNAPGNNDDRNTVTTAVELQKEYPCSNNLNVDNPLIGEGSEDPSVAECDELYGPDKEPLIQKFPEIASIKPPPCEVKVNDVIVSGEIESSSGGEKSLHHPHQSEDVMKKEKVLDSNTKKQSDNRGSVAKKVEAYIKEHLRPLCKSGIITVEQYRWAVSKTTDKVMKYHSKEKNANFLIKEGDKVKKLAAQYVETAQKVEIH